MRQLKIDVLSVLVVTDKFQFVVESKQYSLIAGAIKKQAVDTHHCLHWGNES